MAGRKRFLAASILSRDTLQAVPIASSQVSVPSLYRAMRRLADGKPDANGQNTAISGTTELKFRQVYIMHPPAQVAAVDGAAPPQIAPTR